MCEIDRWKIVDAVFQELNTGLYKHMLTTGSKPATFGDFQDFTLAVVRRVARIKENL